MSEENLGYERTSDGKKTIWTTRKDIAENVFFLKGKPFTLKDYPPLHAIYESSARKIVICSGRQVSKSTTAANFLVAEEVGTPHWEAIAVLPSVMQMRRFSNQRVGKVISDSPQIKRWFVNNTCKRNTMERSFLNGSTIYFGALSQIESLRGLSANRIIEDEVQDMVSDDLPIVEESLSGQSSDRQFIMRTGTAKTVGNVLETTLRMSTMNEWIIICPSGHHNLPSSDNISIDGFRCKKCKSLCNVREGYWRSMNGLTDPDGKARDWVGFRIPQIILPLHAEDEEKWAQIVWKMHNIDPITFNNEVMGQAAGSGITILTEDDLRNCCNPGYSNYELYVPGNEHYLTRWGTVDWGLSARKSYTIVTIWGLTVDHRLKLLHAHRYINPDIFKQVEDIARKFQAFGVGAIGVDWGAGVAQSRILEETMRKPVQRFMYVGEQRQLTQWDDNWKVWKVNRTQAMTETFIKMKRQRYWFPEWKFFQNYAKDILTIYEEPLDDRNGNDKIKYDHPEDAPDDFAHCCVYANLLYHLATDRGQGLNL